jgi:hypothetical protein
MKRIIYIFFIILLIIVSLSGITSCSPGDNSLTDEESKVVDSLYRLEEVKIQPVLDSLCDSVKNKTYPRMVDSIKKVRQEEVIKLLTE